MMLFKLNFLLLMISLYTPSNAVEYCDQGTGECKEFSATGCPFIFYNQHLIGSGVKYCDEFNDIVCCPLPLNMQKMYNQNQSEDKLKRFEKECIRYNRLRASCRTTPFILGGTKAAGKEFPFMALLGRRIPGKSEIKWDCGGTLIHPKFILTAAHCLYTTETKEQNLDPNFVSSKFVVRLGELDYNSTTDDAQPQDFNIVNYVVHPSYNDDDNESRHNDIALVELSREANINEYVSPACLPPSGANHDNLMTAGWGFTKNAGQPSVHLLKVSLERFSDEICQERIEYKIDLRTQFCAGSDTRSGVDTCNGDSGGPMFIQHPQFNCLKQIIGITSYGLLCGERGLPSVYTKVHLFTPWIESIVWPE